MDSLVRIYMDRSENEFRLAKGLLLLSGKNGDVDVKKQLEFEKTDTFYSAVISHAYYAMFYAAKALLFTKGIDTKAPEIHKKTIDAFRKEFVDTGILDLELLVIYKKMIVTANELLNIFGTEKWKRGHFTYQTIPQTNLPVAEESLQNSKNSSSPYSQS